MSLHFPGLASPSVGCGVDPCQIGGVTHGCGAAAVGGPLVGGSPGFTQAFLLFRSGCRGLCPLRVSIVLPRAPRRAQFTVGRGEKHQSPNALPRSKLSLCRSWGWDSTRCALDLGFLPQSRNLPHPLWAFWALPREYCLAED